MLAVLKDLPANKSPGTDKSVYDMFKRYSVTMLNTMCSLFNVIFVKGIYPKWAEGMIILLYKKGNKDDLNNFRDITLLSCFGKIFDSILCNRLISWMTEYRVLCPAQGGFRAGYSTCDSIFTLQGLITKSFYSKQKLYIGFIGFQESV